MARTQLREEPLIPRLEDRAPPRDDQPASELSSLRRTGIAVAVLFLLATVTYTVGNALIRSITDSAKMLENAYPDRGRLAAGVLLELIDAAAAVGIGVFLVRVLRRRSERAANAYLVSRVIEATLVVVGALSALALVTVGRDVGAHTVADAHRVVGDVVVQSSYTAFRASMIALGIGSLFMCWVLYETRLVPRTISALGFIGYALLILWGAIGIWQSADATMALFGPGALFEVLFPLWLLFRGFSMPQREGGRP